MKWDDDFDKEFNKAQKTMVAVWVVGVLVSLGVLGFLGWVIVMVMKYFGVI